jgi:alpha-galactosidase
MFPFDSAKAITGSRLRVAEVSLTLLLVLGCMEKAAPARAPGTAGPSAASVVINPALTPPMGFNDWNAFGCDVDEKLIRQTADVFVSSGLKAAGYQYVNIDDCWSLRERGPDGRLVADPVKFPGGIHALADYVHARGLKLGIYGDAGTKTCAGFPGSLGREQLDAETWAAWGVDYVKYDNCSNQSDGSRADYVRRYTAMRQALDKTGRSIVYSICEWGESQPWEWARGVGHLWRTTGDISDNWASIKEIFSKNAPLWEHAGPGHWNDPDMLEIGNGGMTATEYRAHMSLWAMMAAPLIIGTDLRKASAETFAILGHRGVIAIDQDPLGKQARVIAGGEGPMVLARPLANEDVAIAFYNPTDAQRRVTTTAAAGGLPKAPVYRLEDVWTGEVTSSAPDFGVGVAAHAVALYRVRPAAPKERLRPALSVDAVLDTLIPNQPGGATLEVTLRNQGNDTVTEIGAEVSTPSGWQVKARAPIARAPLAPGATTTGTWEVSVPPGTEPGNYALAVNSAFTWSGEPSRGRSSLDVTATVVTAPRAGTSHLSALTTVRAVSASGPVELDASAGGPGERDGNLLSIANVVHTRGLGLRAPGELTYYLGQACSLLTVDAGIDDDPSGRGSATFGVEGDGKLLAEAGPLRSGDPTRHLRVDVTGVQWLRLTTKPVNGYGAPAPVDWASPLLTCGNGVPASTGEKIVFSFESEAEPFVARPGAGGRFSRVTTFHTDGMHGAQIESPTDGNWFGHDFDAPLDLSGKTKLVFDVRTHAQGTPGELAVEMGPDKVWCQGAHFAWTNPGSTRSIKTALKDLKCSQQKPLDPRQIRGVWVFVKGGTFVIDQVRAE